MIPVAVVGAGIAGLACARRLVAAGMAPVLLDKGRGPGGRVSTRRAEVGRFDHGAQYVTARGAGFGTVLDELEAGGTLAPWPDGSGRAPRVGMPGMSALPRALAAGLEIRQNTQVARIVPEGGGWTLHLPGGAIRAARVVLTLPAPQAAALLPADHPLAAALAPVRLDPCLTLMAAVSAAPPFVSRRDPDDPLAWIAQDSSKPGRPRATGALWVAQAGARFSRTHLEQDPAAIAAAMLPLLCDRLGVGPAQVTHAAAHRWRYARVTQPLGQPFLADDTGSLHLGGDWCLGPRVEAAWDSGTAIAADLLARR